MININLEEMLKILRTDKGWTTYELAEKINHVGVSEKNIRKWELGLEYPEIDVIYQLSDLYSIPSEDLLMARQISLESGLDSIHMRFIKYLCFWLGVSIKVAFVLEVLFYIFALWFAFSYIHSAGSRVG